MPRPTLHIIEQKLDAIMEDVKELKKGKVGTEVWNLQLKQVEREIEDVKKDVESIYGYGKWLVLFILGAIVSAVLNLVVRT
jgi:hypothetical protein